MKSMSDKPKSYLHGRLRELRRQAAIREHGSAGESDLPYSGLTNEAAARVMGFNNRLQWAQAKKQRGIARQATQHGLRYVIGSRRAEEI